MKKGLYGIVGTILLGMGTQLYAADQKQSGARIEGTEYPRVGGSIQKASKGAYYRLRKQPAMPAIQNPQQRQTSEYPQGTGVLSRNPERNWDVYKSSNVEGVEAGQQAPPLKTPISVVEQPPVIPETLPTVVQDPEIAEPTLPDTSLSSGEKATGIAATAGGAGAWTQGGNVAKGLNSAKAYAGQYGSRFREGLSSAGESIRGSRAWQGAKDVAGSVGSRVQSSYESARSAGSSAIESAKPWVTAGFQSAQAYKEAAVQWVQANPDQAAAILAGVAVVGGGAILWHQSRMPYFEYWAISGNHYLESGEATDRQYFVLDDNCFGDKKCNTYRQKGNVYSDRTDFANAEKYLNEIKKQLTDDKGLPKIDVQDGKIGGRTRDKHGEAVFTLQVRDTRAKNQRLEIGVFRNEYNTVEFTIEANFIGQNYNKPENALQLQQKLLLVNGVVKEILNILTIQHNKAVSKTYPPAKPGYGARAGQAWSRTRFNPSNWRRSSGTAATAEAVKQIQQVQPEQVKQQEQTQRQYGKWNPRGWFSRGNSTQTPAN